MSSYIEFSALEKRFGRVTALAGIDLTIERGGILALLGPNGAGKSTLFGCLLGVTHPTAGTITFCGEPLTDVARSRFGYVAERVALYPHRSVLDNGIFFARLRGQDQGEVERQLKRVGLEHVRDRRVRELSKGLLQRLGLAIALCGRPELLVLDEPFNGLDPSLLEDLREILREENGRGATLLISTHTMSAVEPLATHAAMLFNGRLAAFDTLEQLRGRHGAGDSLEAIYHHIACSQRSVREMEVCA